MLDRIKFDGDTSEVPARSSFLANQSKLRTGGVGLRIAFSGNGPGILVATKSRSRFPTIGIMLSRF